MKKHPRHGTCVRVVKPRLGNGMQPGIAVVLDAGEEQG